MQTIPSFEYFAHSMGRSFDLQTGPGQSVPLELQQVEQRVPMNARYECFSLLFLLPPGLDLPQALYCLAGPQGERWEVLLTPVRPDSSGRSCLEAVY
ncbi:hypothetical protein HP532_27020, partial [Pseudomonas sp. CrR25]|nr:hypothetical protein [Pseudomonas sp. CrR25]